MDRAWARLTGWQEEWEEVAAELGLSLERERVRRRPKALVGKVDGVPVEIWWRPGGESAPPTTSARLRFRQPDTPPGFEARVGTVKRARRSQDSDQLPVVIEGRKRAWRLRAQDPARLESWLTPARRSALETLLGNPRTVELEPTSLLVVFHGRGISSSAVREVVAVAKVLETGSTGAAWPQSGTDDLMGSSRSCVDDFSWGHPGTGPDNLSISPGQNSCAPAPMRTPKLSGVSCGNCPDR